MSGFRAFQTARGSAVPGFIRLAWVSEQARAAWELRLARIAAAVDELEWRSVAAGLRRCALASTRRSDVRDLQARLAEHGLTSKALASDEALPAGHQSAIGPRLPRPEAAQRVVIGAREDVAAFEGCRVARDGDAIGKLLGEPECCRRFSALHRVERRCTDTTWPIAARRIADGASRTVEIAEGHAATNVFWRALGLRAVPHLPCAFDCRSSQELADALLNVAHGSHAAREMGWLHEVLSWPVEWSALNGIAEIKTPILKIMTRTDVTPGKCIVRWCGTTYPAEGAKGLGFPYRTSRPAIAGSTGYRRGLANPLPGEAEQPG